MERWKTAAYLRLSSDDGDKAESNSITNQKSMINIYIRKNKDLKLKDYYIDDGYSGTDFERPDFKRMIKDIENGRINTIIVKDLSRFGRNYIEVGKYIEQFFPLYNIRFIAINDNVDSFKDPDSIDNIIVPFKNLLNDEYARDISNKVKSVLNIKKENGDFIGSYAPYGYIRDPDNLHKFIVDEKTSKVVKKIFKMILDGKSKKMICDSLNKFEVPTPAIYKEQTSKCKCRNSSSVSVWNTKKIDYILKNRTYTGVLEQGKRKKLSHKIHKDIYTSPDDWIVIPNHHKALICSEDFEKVQDILYKRDIKVNRNNQYDLFAGHIKCADCGNTLTKVKGRLYDYYYCSSYLRNKECSKHTCQIHKLEEIVIEAINSQIQVAYNIENIVKLITKYNNVDYDTEILNNKLKELMDKKKKYIQLKEDVREDFANDYISEEEYNEYKNDYTIKLKKIENQYDKINNEIKRTNPNTNISEGWIEKFKEREGISQLNNKVVNELIDDIYIYDNGYVTIKFKFHDKFVEAIKFIKDNLNIYEKSLALELQTQS